MLDQIIEQSQPAKQEPASATSPTEWDSFLHGIVKPHLVAKAHPRQEEMIDAVDAAASELMRMILHHEDFQAVESAWRGLWFLVSRLETDSQLKPCAEIMLSQGAAEQIIGKGLMPLLSFLN